ncbi:hypothetical protein AHFPHNDE_03499 [Pseudomonas sp. MM227]|nr:hypothetical protein AHFPHNDE_03499 [Pseudomonas sp. MM227]
MDIRMRPQPDTLSVQTVYHFNSWHNIQITATSTQKKINDFLKQAKLIDSRVDSISTFGL